MSTYSVSGSGLGAKAIGELDKSLLKSPQPLEGDMNPMS